MALGSVKKASTDTVVLKKVVLSGSPFKVRSKLATVRHMFYEPRDVLVRLARASHGKCIFNEQLTMNDEVRMALYKRVFPKLCTEEEIAGVF